MSVYMYTSVRFNKHTQLRSHAHNEEIELFSSGFFVCVSVLGVNSQGIAHM